MGSAALTKIKKSGLIFIPGIILISGLFTPGATQEAISVSVVKYSADSLKDPFEVYSEKKKEQEPEAKLKAKPLPPLTVQGIIWGTPLPQAIINGKVLKIGDMIDGVEITRIDKEGVEVFYAGRSYFLASPASGGKPQGGQR